MSPYARQRTHPLATTQFGDGGAAAAAAGQRAQRRTVFGCCSRAVACMFGILPHQYDVICQLKSYPSKQALRQQYGAGLLAIRWASLQAALASFLPPEVGPCRWTQVVPVLTAFGFSTCS